MSDYRKPTDGELFRIYRPGAGMPAEPRETRPWRGRRLTGDHSVLLSLSKRSLSDGQAIEFVRGLARWLNKPHGLVGYSDREATDRALSRLLYGMTGGEVSFHLEKLKRENAERDRSRQSKREYAQRTRVVREPATAKRTRAAETADACGVDVVRNDDEMARRQVPSQSDAPWPTSSRTSYVDDLEARRLAAYLAVGVPRDDAIRIVALIANDAGVALPPKLRTDFETEASAFFAAHVPRTRARRYLDVIQARASVGAPWIRTDRDADPVTPVERRARREGDPPRAYEPWSPEEEARLTALHSQALPVGQIAANLGRHVGGVRSRLRRLGLIGGVIYITAALALELLSAGTALVPS